MTFNTLMASLALATTLMGCARTAEIPQDFASLPTGGELAVNYESQHCFGSMTAVVSIHKGDPTWARVSRFGGTGGWTRLSSAEVRALDSFVAYIREAPAGACTSGYTISLLWTLPDGAVVREHFETRDPDFGDAFPDLRLEDVILRATTPGWQELSRASAD